MRSIIFACSVLIFSVPVLDMPASAESPLHLRIDEMIKAAAGGAVNPPADDASFLRRIYLDFAGRIPTAGELRAFLADPSEDKRRAVVGRLLDGDEYPRRMREAFDVMLMERRGTHEDWERFLESSFAANKPWDQMVREMIYADPEDESARGGAFFFTKRLEAYGQNPTDMPGLVRDIGRLFLGVDVQCAECHDHLFVDQYKQADYQGLFAFVGNAFIRRDTSFPAVGENPLMEKVKFVSVFEDGEKSTGPRLPLGKEFEIPKFNSGEEYLEPPDRKKRTPGVLKFSPLKLLSEELPSANNRAFCRNIVNRLWWLMIGRGIVEPLDLNHTDNPPTHPELLDLLAAEFEAHDFDMKWLLREIALSDTYQRSTLLPDDDDRTILPESYRVGLERPLSAEQLMHSMLFATGQFAAVTKDQADGSVPDAILATFRDAFANPPKEPEIDFHPSVKAALFVLNDETVLGWLQPRDDNLAGRLLSTDDAGRLAEELYANILSRSPNEAERQEVQAYLAEQTDRERAVRNLAWALLASTEFCTNH